MAENVFQDKALQSYLQDIANIEPLSQEKEKELAVKAQNGDKSAEEMLIRSNLKFVVKVAAKYQNRGLSLSELISEGNIGLIKAIEKFDPKHNNKLISYAVWWIKQRILFALAEKTDVIKTPLSKVNIANKIKKAEKKLFQKTGKKASIDEIADITDLSVNIIEKTRKQNVSTFSIDKAFDDDQSNPSTYLDFLADQDITDPKTLYYREKVEDSIEKSLDKLPSREAYIVKKYFGLEGEKTKNFAQIGKELGLSRERVRQIQKEALEKILSDTYKEAEKDIDFLISDY